MYTAHEVLATSVARRKGFDSPGHQAVLRERERERFRSSKRKRGLSILSSALRLRHRLRSSISRSGFRFEALRHHRSADPREQKWRGAELKAEAPLPKTWGGAGGWARPRIVWALSGFGAWTTSHQHPHRLSLEVGPNKGLGVQHSRFFAWPCQGIEGHPFDFCRDTHLICLA